MAEAHALPLSHQPGRAPSHLQRDGCRYSLSPAPPRTTSARWAGLALRDSQGPAQCPDLTWKECPRTCEKETPPHTHHRLLYTHYSGFYPNQRHQGTLTFSRHRPPHGMTMSEEGSKSPHCQANPPHVLPHPGLQGMRLHWPTLAAGKSIGPAAPHPAGGNPVSCRCTRQPVAP